MHNPLTVITIICLYVGFLFLIALWVERGSARIKRIARSPIVYSLALAVYCTSWTYYGSVGSAANAGMLFLTIYLGVTMAVVLWWFIIRKLVRIKTRQRITSIADFVSACYGKSQTLAAIATLLALIGTGPYIALQLKAVINTFALITTSDGGGAATWIGSHVGWIVVGLMIVFTIVFGVRRLDPTERHEGVMAALAVECVVKLIAFLAIGIFVTYFVYDGFDDIFQRLAASPFQEMMTVAGKDASSYITWMTYLVLAMSAIMFLPRGFHVAVVENSNENHLRTAIWLFPLYLFLINIFVVPIAAGGLLQGLPKDVADSFVLRLPLLFNQTGLALFVFIGGFSAATGMIIVDSMTVGTMVTNHLIVPLLDWAPQLGFLRRHLLRVRWVAVTLIIMLGYGFERLIGESYTLVNIGIISFAAVLQFAPIILGGLFWRRANKIGAILGLSAGSLIWFYTLFLPSLVRSGWLPNTLLENGPAGLGWLRPEQLFGLVGLGPIPHTVFWSLLFNIGFYVLGSLYFEKNAQEERITESFVGALESDVASLSPITGEADINLADKQKIITNLLTRYFTQTEAAAIIDKSLDAVGIRGKNQVSVAVLAKFYNQIEKSLAGSIGAAAAHRALTQAGLFTVEESATLSGTYGQILVDLRLSPEELRKRIDYYQERETLLANQAIELEKRVAERTRALEIGAQISRQLTTILDIDELLQQVIDLIQHTLNCYHVHIYLVDVKTNELIMREGSGEVGQRIKAQGHKLKLGQGIVGSVAKSGQAVLVEDVEKFPDFFRNPLLTHTHSELAVPLRKGQTTVGVLDMQSEQVGGFNETDLTLMQSVADQLAIALENAGLFKQTQAALAQIETVHQQYLAQTWGTFRKSQQRLQVEQKRTEAPMPEHSLMERLKQQAIQQGKTVTMASLADSQEENSESAQTALVVPLKLRGQIIGTLGLQEFKGDRSWTEDELALIEAVSEQISQALERARLFEETQRAAWRDSVISESTAKVWSSSEIEEVMRTAVAQLGDKLGASEVVIRLGTESELSLEK